MQIFIATEVTRRQDPIQPGPACPRQKKKKRQDMEQKTGKKLTIRSTPPPPLPDGLKRFRRWIVTHAPDPSNPTKDPRRDMLGANTRPRRHPESRVRRHRFRVAAAAKTPAARDGDEGRREALGWLGSAEPTSWRSRSRCTSRAGTPSRCTLASHSRAPPSTNSCPGPLWWENGILPPPPGACERVQRSWRRGCLGWLRGEQDGVLSHVGRRGGSLFVCARASFLTHTTHLFIATLVFLFLIIITPHSLSTIYY